MAPTVVPVPVPDGGDASSVWRNEKLREFIWQAKVQGMEDDPQIVGLLEQMAEHTQALEELLEQQKDESYIQPWWQDGEYDNARADEANDHGVQTMKAGQLSQAFDCFTEAIRLCPTSPVYHCNRAAVALKLSQPAIAAEDAAQAIQRDAACLRAYLRGGHARLQLQQPEAAVELFQRAIELDRSCAAAKNGLAIAQELAAQLGQAREAEQAAAAAGARPGLSKRAMAEHDAAEQLLAAERMSEANPDLQAARCALVEAHILVGRYTDAAAACEGLLIGVDRQYLEAEVLWRQGNVQAALEQLQAAIRVAPTSSKCTELHVFLLEVEHLQQQAQLASEDGVFQECIEAASELTQRLEPQACTGLYCTTLLQRADAYAARSMHSEALADLNAALALESAHPACLRARAEAHKQLGRYVDYFLDIQRLSKAAPGTPGLLQLLEDAAKLSLGGPRTAGASGSSSTNAASKAGMDALELLGLTASATTAHIRRAYLALAAKHHPDKWAAASEEEQRSAEARFKDIQRAYEALTS